jgi:simple sugar transport system permease protein
MSEAAIARQGRARTHDGGLTVLWRFAFSAAAAVLILGVVVAAFGASPLVVYREMFSASLGSSTGIANSLALTCPLILTGLAAAIPFRTGLWNIGGEGQLYAGAILATWVGLSGMELPSAIFILLLLGAGMVGGALLGLIAAALRLALGVSEVITTLMLNFIAILLATYVISDVWPQAVGTQTREVPDSSRLPTLWSGTDVTVAVLISVAVALACWVVMRFGTLGFIARAVGANEQASHTLGVNVRLVRLVAFALGAAFAGLAGALQIVGPDGALIFGFSSEYGYIGIAIALVAGLSPLTIVPTAFAFAALQVGSQQLPGATGLPTSLGGVLIALFVVTLLVTGGARVKRAA